MGSNQQALLGYGGSAAASDPSTISNLQLWLKGDYITGKSDGDRFTAGQKWLDASGNGRDGTAVVISLGAQYKATFGPNSKPCVYMASGYFTLPDFSGLGWTAGHQFQVIQYVGAGFSPGQGGGATGDFGTASDAYYGYDGDGKLYSNFATNARKDAIPFAVTHTNWNVYEERSASAAWSARINGGSAVFSTGTNTVAYSSAPLIGRCLNPSSKQMDGYVAEVIFYSRVLNSTEITTVYTYLNSKYGFSLS